MKILSVSTDRNIFKKGSDVRSRVIDQGSVLDELHIIVFAKKGLGLKKEQIAKNVWAYPTNSLSRWLYMQDAIRLGRQCSGMDVITVQDPFETGLAGRKIAKHIGAKLQVQIHTDFLSPYFVRGGFLNAARVHMAGKTLAVADCIRVVSDRIKESIEKRYSVRVPVSVLPVFVNLERFRGLVRTKHPRFETTLLVVSRLEKEKNVMLALEAFAKARRAGYNVGLVVVGSGSEEKALQARAQKLGIEEYIEFAGWQDDLPAYYAQTDLVLVPSLYEGFGVTIVEALAAGIPVLSTDVGVACEAGAIIAQPADFFAALVAWLESGDRHVELKLPLHTDRETYWNAYKDTLETCAS